MRTTSGAQSAASAAPSSRSVPQDAMEQTHMRRLTRAALWTAPLAVVVIAAALFTMQPTAPVTMQPPPPVAAQPTVSAQGPAAASVPTSTPPAASVLTPALPAPAASVPAPPAATPPLVSTLKVAARPGESVAESNRREKIAREHLDDGKRAMDQRRYADAIALLQSALDGSDRRDFGYTAGEAASLIKRPALPKPLQRGWSCRARRR